MTLPEQAGKIASEAVAAMKGSPGLLAVILMQGATLGLLYFLSSANSEHRQAREMYLLENCLQGKGDRL